MLVYPDPIWDYKRSYEKTRDAKSSQVQVEIAGIGWSRNVCNSFNAIDHRSILKVDIRGPSGFILEESKNEAVQ